MSEPIVTIVVPSFNQGAYLGDALRSIFEQKMPVEVFVLDGGSSDNSIRVIEEWDAHITGWRSYKDDGQAAAINEGVALGSAPFVCWLNSDDWFLPSSLSTLHQALEARPNAPAVYGLAWNYLQETGRLTPVFVEPFNSRRLASRSIICQPATLIRRSAWERVGGVNSSLHMAMDYDLWWRLYKEVGPLEFLNEFVAVNREHEGTKTRNFRRLHYLESIAVVRNHYGSIPLRWWLTRFHFRWLRAVVRFLKNIAI